MQACRGQSEGSYRCCRSSYRGVSAHGDKAQDEGKTWKGGEASCETNIPHYMGMSCAKEAASDEGGSHDRRGIHGEGSHVEGSRGEFSRGGRLGGRETFGELDYCGIGPLSKPLPMHETMKGLSNRASPYLSSEPTMPDSKRNDIPRKRRARDAEDDRASSAPTSKAPRTMLGGTEIESYRHRLSMIDRGKTQHEKARQVQDIAEARVQRVGAQSDRVRPNKLSFNRIIPSAQNQTRDDDSQEDDLEEYTIEEELRRRRLERCEMDQLRRRRHESTEIDALSKAAELKWIANKGFGRSGSDTSRP